MVKGIRNNQIKYNTKCFIINKKFFPATISNMPRASCRDKE